MDKKQDTAGIIERLEAASGPDREIDEAIYQIFGATIPWNRLNHQPLAGHAEISASPTLASSHWLPFYTSSIDAALSLVDLDAWAIDELMIWKGCRIRFRLIPILLETHGGRTAHFSQGYGLDITGPTMPIALCIAALRARAHKGEE